MKKTLMVGGVLVITIFLYIFSFGYSKPINPHYYYQVYLDGKVVGTIKSKRQLEDYINSQGSKVRDNVKKYNEQLESIDVTKQTLQSVKLSEEDVVTYNKLDITDKVKYIIKNSEKLKISQLKVEQLKYYIDNNLNQLSDNDIKQMSEYSETNDIYL